MVFESREKDRRGSGFEPPSPDTNGLVGFSRRDQHLSELPGRGHEVRVLFHLTAENRERVLVPLFGRIAARQLVRDSQGVASILLADSLPE